MNFIDKLKNTFASDKKGHFTVGAVLGLSCFYDVAYSLVLLQFVAMGKEFYDSFFPKSHTTDMMDYAATVCGGAFTLTIYFIALKVLELF